MGETPRESQALTAKRRLRILKEISDAARHAVAADEAARLSCEALASHPEEFRGVFIYRLEAGGRRLRLSAAWASDGTNSAPEMVALEPSSDQNLLFLEALEEGVVRRILPGLDSGNREQSAVGGDHSIFIALQDAQELRPCGVVHLVLAPETRDDEIEDFLGLLADALAQSMVRARSREVTANHAATVAAGERSKTAFLSNVSQEFRNPLTLMLGHLSEVLEQEEKTLPEPVFEQLSAATSQGLRLQILVDTLLDFSAIEAKRLRSVFQPIDFAAATEDVVSSFRAPIETAGITFKVDCARISAPVYLDVRLWERIVLNLVSNAFKHTFQGKIEVRVREERSHVVFEVEDSGAGILEDHLPFLFDRFFRVPDAASRSHEGLGIGLSLVREFVELHGGEVEVDTELTRGSCFRVRIPFGYEHLPFEQIGHAPASEAEGSLREAFVEQALAWLPQDPGVEGQPDVEEGNRLLGGASILVVDASEAMGGYLRRLLMAAGARVSVARDGEAAWRMIAERRPDLVVVDAFLPGLSGVDLLRRVRDRDETRTLPVVVLSSRVGEEAKLESLEAGADEFLAKPFMVREFLATIGAQLYLARTRNETETQLRDRSRRLAFLSEAAWSLLTTSDPRAFLDQTFDRLVELLDLDAYWYLEELEDSGSPRVVCGRGVDLEVLQDFMDFRFAASICGEAVESRRHVVISNVSESEGKGSAFLKENGFAACGCWPLLDGDGVLGSLTFATKSRGRLGEESISLLKTVCGYVATMIARGRSDTALRESETRFRLLVEGVSSAVWESDAEGRILADSESWRRYTGADLDELLSDRWSDAFHPDDRTRVLARWRAGIESGAPWESEFEFRLRRADGAWRWSIVRAAPLILENGSIAKWVGMTMDCHERKVAEDEVREADRRKSEFLATLAHELRNPLAPIANSLELMKLADDPSSSHPDLRNIMETQAHHLSRLVDDLLEVSRISRGVIRLSPEFVELGDVLCDAVAGCRPLLDERNHELVLDLTAEPLVMSGDPVRLVQVVSNLLNNAARYTDDGGRICLSSKRIGETAEIRVRDNGIGIAPEQKEGIFELFTQVDQSLTRKRGGLGIGLSLVKNFVAMHEGQIEVSSAGAGQGSEFVIRFPLEVSENEVRSQSLAEAAPSKERGLPRKRRILVVDDSRVALLTLGRLLEKLGQEVRTISDSAAVLDLALRDVPEVIISDIAMPDLDGFELARRLSAEESLEETTLVALTGYGQGEDRERAREAGFGRYLVKPTSYEQLRALLDDLDAGAGDAGSVR